MFSNQSVRFGREAIYQGNSEEGMDEREAEMADAMRYDNFLPRHGKKM